jgi:hypothetical protein
MQKMYIYRNEHYFGIHDACIKSGEFVAEGVLYKGKRDLVLGLHDISIRGDGRVRLRQHHIQKKVRNPSSFNSNFISYARKELRLLYANPI